MRSHTVPKYTQVSWNAKSVLGVFALLLMGSTGAFAQPPMGPMAQPSGANAADQNKQLADQVTELQAQVTRLQAAVQQTGPNKKAASKSGMKMVPSTSKAMGMGMMDDKGEMGMPPKGGMASSPAPMAMEGGDGEMGSMAPAAAAPMSPGMGMGGGMGGMPMGGKGMSSSAPAPAMGMCCMGDKGSGGSGGMGGAPAGGGMAAMNGSSSATPGQAGASHLYHIGSNGFFLNHSQHITLTPDQKATLNHLKEKAMFDQSSEQRRIDQGEQELYSLTGADQPDNTRIQSKVAEIEKLRAGQRMNFIREVEEASNVLTAPQRKALLGTMASFKK